jgi:DNA (cytosine-5)-methyltransferase 1
MKKEGKNLRTIDLFAGIGGIRIGFENAGFETVFANDFDKYCKETYDLNFNNKKLLLKDINEIKSEDLPEFDVLLAGFPCQPFSIAGMRKGFEDEGRGNMFFVIKRILKDRRPRAFLLENVKNLKNHDKGNTYKVIEKNLKELGYYLKTEVLNSAEYGNVPQNRERIYIAGFLKKEDYNRFKFPNKVKLTKNIHDMYENEPGEAYYYNNKPIFKALEKEIVKYDTVYQWRRKYVRENKNNMCPTLTANMGMGGHNVPIIKDKKGIRKLTPKECANFQGFPENYKLPKDMADSRLYKQLGNSVSVTVVERVAKNLKQALGA